MLLIPDEFLRHAKITETELRSEIAVLLYSQNKISFGKAKQLAGLNHFEFQKLLSEKGIDLNYSIQDFETDLQTIEYLKKL